MSAITGDQGLAVGLVFFLLGVGKRTIDGNTKALHRIAIAVEGCRERRRRLVAGSGGVFLDEEAQLGGE